MLNVFVSKVCLKRSCIVASVSQRIAAGMPEHVRVRLEVELCFDPCPLDSAPLFFCSRPPGNAQTFIPGISHSPYPPKHGGVHRDRAGARTANSHQGITVQRPQGQTTRPSPPTRRTQSMVTASSLMPPTVLANHLLHPSRGQFIES